MLTKSDLKQIRLVIREEIESEVSSLKDNLQAEIKLVRIELQRDVRALKDEIKNLSLKIGKIEKQLNLTIKFFDKDYLKLRKRVETIEEHLGLSSQSN